jgi:selenocysteine-specific translation elongation factor
MRSINFVILGDYSIAKELGKKGTESDITIYDKKSNNSIYSFITPTLFPDKIQVLIQSINMAEYAILNIDKFDRYLGESIIALDILNLRDLFILKNDTLDIDKLNNILNTTRFNYKYLDLEELKVEIDKLAIKSKGLEPLVYIDHVFDIKGVGTVVLGILKEGKIKVYDELIIMPLERNVTIKSIQLHGNNVEEAVSPARVGLALKGVKANEISRGDMISNINRLSNAKELIGKFEKSPFFNEPINESEVYMLALGLQIKAVKAQVNNCKIILKSEKSIAYSKDNIALLLKPDSKKNRIVGKVTIE